MKCYTLYFTFISRFVNCLQTVNVIIDRVYRPSPTAGPVGNQSADFSAAGFYIQLIFNLARSANLPTGLYILPSVISFFFFKLSNAISGFTGPIFTIFSRNGRYLRDCC